MRPLTTWVCTEYMISYVMSSKCEDAILSNTCTGVLDRSLVFLGSYGRSVLVHVYLQLSGQFTREVLKMSVERLNTPQVGHEGVSRYALPAICYLSIKAVIIVPQNRVTCRYSMFLRNENTPTPTLKLAAIQCSQHVV